MSSSSSPPPRIGVPYRTKNEEVKGQSAKLQKYLSAVSRAGAEPVPISLQLSASALRRLADTLDGVLLSGSPADVDSAHFGAVREPESADPDPDRERVDFAILEHAFAEQKPVLAICYGIQSLNVFRGGTLIQDIPRAIGKQVEHDHEDDAPETFHAVSIEPGALLARVAGAAEAVVNSSHHQSVAEPGRGLRVVARAADGVVESVELADESHWVLGVQWHPERMAPADVRAESLFRSLVAAAAKRKSLARTG
jgi:putative glutamine amidotransferase